MGFVHVMCYVANWNPVECPLADFLKSTLLDLEVAILVWCCLRDLVADLWIYWIKNLA